MSEPKQILVIDDEKDIAEIVATVVTSYGDRKVINAASPSEAYMRSIVQKFDLVISDHRMPKTTGSDLVKVIRGQKLNAHVPIIMITGYPEEVMDLTSSMSDLKVVPKPFDTEFLGQLVTDMLSVKINKDTKKPQFDLDVLNEFIKAASSTIVSLAGVQEVKTDKPFLLSKDRSVSVYVSGVIKIQTDKFRGTLALSFNKDILLKLINCLSHKEFTELSGAAEPFVQQLITLMYGQAKASLIKDGVKVTDGVLHVVADQSQRARDFEGHVTIVIPVHTAIGDFYLFATAS